MSQGNSMIGRTMGQYQILEEIGRGGMAIVYKAWQPTLQRHVALKVLSSHLIGDREFVQRFQQEAVVAANLSHPNIVTVYDVMQQDGSICIAMEYVEGRSLDQVITEEGPLSLDRTERILKQVAEALDYAHRRHFVHRDIKPGNILLTAEDRAVITDFGIAKALQGSGFTSRLTTDGTALGTPAYMSPEQIQGQPVDYRTDLYSLGIVCYEMLSGMPPFDDRTTTAAILYAQVHKPPPDIRQVNPSVPGYAASALNRLLAKRPADRFPSAGVFVDALAGKAVAAEVPKGKTAVMPPGEQAAYAPPPSQTAQQPISAPWSQPAVSPSPPPEAGKRRGLVWGLIAGGIVLTLLALGLCGGVLWTTGVLDDFLATETPEPALNLPSDILFHSDRDGDYEIYVLEIQTGEVRQLTDNSALDIRPNLSPDGEKIAFQSERDGNEEIYVMASDGSDERRLTDNEYRDMKPIWSPDGGTIAFESDRDGNPELYTMDSDGGSIVRLTDHPARDWAPNWSPDGSKIAFLSDRDTEGHRYQIYVMDADGSNVRRLTDNEFDDRVFSWSPDGNRIVFASDRADGNWDIYVMSSEGEEVSLRRLTESPGRDWNPAWSLDGTRIAFESDREGNNEIYVMDPDGQNQERLTSNLADDGRPRWAPSLP